MELLENIDYSSFSFKDFRLPENIRFGINTIYSLRQEIKDRKPQKVILISDSGLEKSGILDFVEKDILEESVQIKRFTNINGEPTFNIVISAIDFINKEKGDIIIGIGGGSALDVAKAAAALADKEEVEIYLSGAEQVKERSLPLILIPTTAGTGSEVTMNAIFEDQEQEIKRGIISPVFLPDVAIIDPALTKSCPPKVTAASGVDAFTHAIESYISNNATPITRMYAETAMKSFSDNITTAVFNGQDIQSRIEMSKVSLLAGVSLANAGVGAVHALAYPLGAKYHIQHGVANALLMPYVFAVIGKTCLNDMVNVADFLNLGKFEHHKNKALPAVVNYLYELLIDLELPKTLAELNVEESSLEVLTKQASKIYRLLDNTPFNLDEKKIFEIYEKAYKGF